MRTGSPELVREAPGLQLVSLRALSFRRARRRLCACVKWPSSSQSLCNATADSSRAVRLAGKLEKEPLSKSKSASVCVGLCVIQLMAVCIWLS